MALENKKLSTYADLASANIDTTTKLVVLTGATKVNANLPVTNFIEDTLTSSSTVKPLSAKQGKALQDTKAPVANPTFTGTVGGITKAMVGLSNVDNTSDANKPISTAQSAGLAPKANPIFTGNLDLSSSSPILSIDCGADSTVKILLKDDDVEVLEISSEGSLGTSKISSPTRPLSIISNIVKVLNLQTFADNTAAAALEADTLYKTSTGVLMIKY